MVKEHLQVYARLKPLEPYAEPYSLTLSRLPYLALTNKSIELQVSRAKLSNAKENHQFSFHEIFP
jgi:hypothetical protein